MGRRYPARCRGNRTGVNGWALAGTTGVASAVEFVEAATIVMAVGYAQGWRAALGGAVAASLALAAIVALLGPLFANVATLQRIELLIGPFLLLFGFSWLRKAVLRYAGRMPMRDESAIYERQVARLSAGGAAGFAVSFQGVFVEGVEVAVIVVTFAASHTGALPWSVGGATAAFGAVLLAAIVLRKPFARVPENAMKALVGVMLLALGTFWTGEGLHVAWPLGDATLFAIAGLYAAASALAVAALRRVN
jgi:Ca2+/H+ antiporter, TMEM165/GDT1 family